MENKLLWQVRVKAFFVQLGSLIGVAIIGVILSSDFRTLVISHFGDTFVTSSALLFVTGIVSHLSNKLALKKLGARIGDDDIIII